MRTKLRFSSIEARRLPAYASKSPEEQEFVVDSGASAHMLSKKVLSSDELDTLGRSRNSTVVVTTNGKVQTDEEAQENVHDLDLFVTVQILDDTLAVPSLGKLCEDHGCSHDWVSGQKPRLTKEGKTMKCKTDNFRTSCRFRVIHQFWKQLVDNIDIAGFVSNKSSPRAK